MKYKITAIIFLALIALVLAKWLYDNNRYGSVNLITKYQRPVVTKKVDEMFGTTTEKTTYQDGFWLGLLPDDDRLSARMLVGVLPLSFIFVLVSGVNFVVYIKKRKK